MFLNCMRLITNIDVSPNCFITNVDFYITLFCSIENEKSDERICY